MDETTLAPIPPWLLTARAEIGVTEFPGPEDNPRIQEYFEAAGHGAHEHDSVAWCSAFVNWVFRQNKMPRTGKANARSWLDWGIPLSQARLGCVVVYRRPAAGVLAGHVGFYNGGPNEPFKIATLGGNQGNRVCVSQESSALLMGWRWPIGVL